MVAGITAGGNDTHGQCAWTRSGLTAVVSCAWMRQWRGSRLDDARRTLEALEQSLSINVTQWGVGVV